MNKWKKPTLLIPIILDRYYSGSAVRTFVDQAFYSSRNGFIQRSFHISFSGRFLGPRKITRNLYSISFSHFISRKIHSALVKLPPRVRPTTRYSSPLSHPIRSYTVVVKFHETRARQAFDNYVASRRQSPSRWSNVIIVRSCRYIYFVSKQKLNCV